MKTSSVALLAAFMCGVFFPCGAQAASPLFDKAVQVKRMALPADPVNPSARAKLSCFYYPHFMVKQVDLGEKGAEQLSILPRADHACQVDNTADEKVIRGWSGYFRGVKGDYVFFDADDGWNGGMGFAIFSGRNGERIFEDTALKIRRVDLAEPGMRINYRRVYMASCSLQDDDGSCGQRIQSETGLKTLPDCAAAYRRQQKKSPEAAEQIAGAPSVIEYETSVALNNTVQENAVLPGKVSCRVSE